MHARSPCWLSVGSQALSSRSAHLLSVYNSNILAGFCLAGRGLARLADLLQLAASLPSTTSHARCLHAAVTPCRLVPAGGQPFMISPLQQPTAAVSLEQQTLTSHQSTYAAFSPESAAAVDGPAEDKCGSTPGARPAHMAPADLAAAHAISTFVVV